MTTTRRVFLKQSAVALASVSVIPGILTSCTTSTTTTTAANTKLLTGVQLYSVRDEMKADPLGTLKQLAAYGFKAVEHASYRERKFYGWSAAEFRKILDDLGMQMPSGHTVMRADHWDAAAGDFTDAWKYTVEDAAVLGQQFVISPSLEESFRQSEDELKKFLDVFNKSGELCKKSGMKFGYHNHDFEFSVKFGDVTMYDVILKNTDPDLVIQQLDMGNLYDGGGDAMEVVKKYPGRFSSIHVKDEIKVADGSESTILGKGYVPVKDVIDIARDNGTIHFIIEQESYQGKLPMDCVKEDLEIMKTWGY